jgi:predicted RNA-binding Zn ribbon-like protein
VERQQVAPYKELVDGLVLPVHLAGHPALDFCNTLAGWSSVRGDYLRTYEHLAVWTAAAGLISPDVVDRLRRLARRSPAEAQSVLERARGLRDAVYSVCLRPRSGPDWDRVAAEGTGAACRAELRERSGRGEWVLPERTGLDLPLLAVAMAVTDLVTSGDLESVGACPGDDCGWLFLDRRGKRRWCTMATCGNRAKARSFASRRRQEPVG